MTTNSGKHAAPTERRTGTRGRIAALGFGLLISLLTVCAAGCGGDDCDAAVDKLTGECGFGTAAAFPGAGQIVECTSQTGCNAQCVLNTSCEDIVSTKSTTFGKCLAKCKKIK